MIRIEFTVQGRPRPKGSTIAFRHSKTGKVITRASNADRLETWQERIGQAAKHAMAQAGLTEPAIPRGPVTVWLTLRLARPLTHYIARDGRRLRPDSPIRHAQPPDLDKLTRAVLDGLTDARVWGDDGQVSSMSVLKRWTNSDQEGVEVIIAELGEEGQAP